MNADTLLKNFEVLAEAPGGIDRLRELILNLAVSGKLVSQVETNEVHLRSEIEGPFQLPDSWRWESITSITSDLGQEVPKSKFQYIDVSSINSKAGRISEGISLLNPEDAPSRARKLVKKGTVLYSTVRPYLRNIAIVEKDFNPKAIASTAFAVLHPSDQILSSYLFMCVRSSYFTQFVESKQKGVAYPAINAGDLKMAIIPLPPVAEQKRIIAKFDELMALCDQLEQQQQQRNNLRIATRKSAIDAISTATTPEELDAAWNRISRNFEVLAEAPGGVDRLRELLLHLGISGKLLPQISAEVREEILWSLNSLRLDEHRIWGADYLQNTPTTWPKVPLARLGSWGSGGTPTRGNKTYYGGEIPWLVIGDLNDGVVTTATNSITKKGLEESSAVIVPVGAVFVAMYGSIGKSGIAGFECATNQAIAHCVPDLKVISTEYLFLVIRAVKPRLFSQGRGLAQQNISQTVLKHLMISVPPLVEQKRIVAKIDELMALCDQLEQQQKLRDNLAEKFARSVVSAV